LIKQFIAIAKTPGMGHTGSELNDDTLRVISVHNFLVIYSATSRPIEIVRVIHGAMNLGPQFRR
jgi:antitoxin ParD1/3/4/toxin ParE1/3/4